MVLTRIPEDLPPDADWEREIAMAQGLKTHVAFPLESDGEVLGFVGFAEIRSRREWSQGVLGRLETVGRVFAGALQRKQADEALKESERRFRTLLEAAPDGVFLSCADGTIRLVNDEMGRMFGYPPDELVGQSVEILVPESLRDRHRRHRADFHEKPAARPMGEDRELMARRKDGSTFPVEISLSPVKTPEGLRACAIVRDISRRKEREATVSMLSGRLIHSQEEERKRIARELHDDLNQRLALLSVLVEQTSQDPDRGDPEIRRTMTELSARLRELSADVHRLSYDLHPSKLDHLGLVVAARSLCREMGDRYEIDIGFSDDGVPGDLPLDVALSLYRIIQEALRNVVRHSGGKRADVAIECKADTIRLIIVDDGKGFDPTGVEDQEGLGLLSMRERLRHLDGALTIESGPSRGTRLEVEIPL